MGSATVEEYIELLNAEQHVDLQKLRDYARHGAQQDVRGEVWLYLMGVLSDDKGQEMTAVRSKYLEYEQMDKHSPALEKRIRAECSRYYQKRLAARPPPGRTLMQSTPRIGSRHPGGSSSSSASLLAAAPSYSRIRGEGDRLVGSGSLSMGGLGGGSANNAIVASLDRGPNRVNDGRIHALGGIIGDSGVTAAIDADDPEAVAAAELKRFGRSVENVICAYLNRSSARQQQQQQQRRRRRRMHHGNSGRSSGPTTAAAEAGGRPRRASSSDLDEFFDEQPQQQQQPYVASQTDHSHGFSEASSLTEALPYDEVHVPMSAASSSQPRSQHRYDQAIQQPQPSSHSRSRAPSTGLTLEDSLKARMPRDYEWMPQLQQPGSPSGGIGGGDFFKINDSVVGQEACNGGSNVELPRQFDPALVYLCAPFVKCIKVEAGMYFAFERLMTMMAEHNAVKPLPLQVATFLTLFRTTLPELHAYFEEEEVDIISFATHWLQHLLAGELRIEDLLRLWDTYFAVADPIDLHLYVCIAILTNCKDSLEELDRSETKSMLYSLPPLDIDRIINEAINIRLSHQQSMREEQEQEEEEEEGDGKGMAS